MTGTYQETDDEGNPVGNPITISFRVFVRGFYVDEPVGSDGKTKTVELSLDEEDNAKTKAIKYKLIDGVARLVKLQLLKELHGALISRQLQLSIQMVL